MNFSCNRTILSSFSHKSSSKLNYSTKPLEMGKSTGEKKKDCNVKFQILAEPGFAVFTTIRKTTLRSSIMRIKFSANKNDIGRYRSTSKSGKCGTPAGSLYKPRIHSAYASSMHITSYMCSLHRPAGRCTGSAQ